MTESALSLYLHIPFCGTRCTYCAFNTYTHAEALIPAYVAALCHELRGLGAVTDAPLHTVYFGGGTPSLLSADQVAAILKTCAQAFEVLPGAEITLEVNPGSVDAAYFSQLRESGVSRLSIGMQSAHADELRLMARDHDAAAVPRTVEAARQAGFDNLNLDLIFGLPYQTMRLWRESVQAALALQPEHLSMYALELESGTALTQNVQRGRLPQPDDDLAAEMYEVADQLATQAGLLQYEISNWARPGRECRHNLQYWHNAPYLGVGAGAHGYANGIRYQVARPIAKYIALAGQERGSLPFPLTPSVEQHEVIDTPTAMSEHMLTGLRLVRQGVSLAGFRERFGRGVEEVYAEPLDWLTRHGLVQRAADRLLLTREARLLSNQVFRRFL